MRAATRTSSDGFTAIELLISTALFGVLAGAVFAVVQPARDMMIVQPEVQDVQQRLRFGVSTLHRAIAFAGAATTTGVYSGAAFQASAAIRPYRIGDRNPDPAQNVFYRPDVLTVIAVSNDAIPARIRTVTVTGTSAFVEVEPNCAGASACGFPVGARVAAIDVTGRTWFGTVRGVQGTSVEVEGADIDPFTTAATGALLVVIDQATYASGIDKTTGTPRITVYDGHLSESPLVDHVIRFAVQYVGDPVPPAVPMEDDLAPWVTANYGPPPPGVSVDVDGDSWPAGENCTFALLDGVHVARLPRLAGDAPVLIPPAMLTDGPWCPDAMSPNRFDADLLRIRRVDIVLRVQVAFAWMRGPASLRFLNGGTGGRHSRLVPDQEIRFSVTPRNLAPGPRR
jgi:prepilin-type N-terminal cleavage/methylation domain-containing protein